MSSHMDPTPPDCVTKRRTVDVVKGSFLPEFQNIECLDSADFEQWVYDVPDRHLHHSNGTALVENKARVEPKMKEDGVVVDTVKAATVPRELKRRNDCSLHWWHAIFLFCGISVLICLLQILSPSPQGMRMTSAEVVTFGIAPEGCEDGLERCICPRETVCATDIISMFLLTIARCSAFFDYPLYMMIFLSKCHNLNNIFRRSIMREFIDFADMHRIHSIFGIVIAVESTSHSFFHIV